MAKYINLFIGHLLRSDTQKLAQLLFNARHSLLSVHALFCNTKNTVPYSCRTRRLFMYAVYTIWQRVMVTLLPIYYAVPVLLPVLFRPEILTGYTIWSVSAVVCLFKSLTNALIFCIRHIVGSLVYALYFVAVITFIPKLLSDSQIATKPYRKRQTQHACRGILPMHYANISRRLILLALTPHHCKIGYSQNLKGSCNVDDVFISYLGLISIRCTVLSVTIMADEK